MPSTLEERVQAVADRLIADVAAAWGGKTHWGGPKTLQGTVPYNIITLEGLERDSDGSTVTQTAYRLKWNIARVEKERAREHPEQRKLVLASSLRSALMNSTDYAGGILHDLTEVEFATDSEEESLLVVSATFEVTVVLDSVT